MSWTACLIWACLGGIAIWGLVEICTAIPQRRPKNQRVAGVLNKPSPDCERRYVP
jgi:hypothetical protein